LLTFIMDGDRIGPEGWAAGVARDLLCTGTTEMGNLATTWRHFRPLTCACLMATATGACSTTATISTVRGSSYEATIDGSSAEALRLQNRDGQRFVVPREDVVDVDHPGNVLMTIGAVMLGVGTLNVLGTYGKVIEPMSGQSQNQAAAAATAVAIIPGAILTIVGATIYGRSRRNAEAFEKAKRAPRPEPRGVSLRPDSEP
jgi:hypothetical protein